MSSPSDPIQPAQEISDLLKQMLERYAQTRRAQNVSFRSLVHWIKPGERATHYVHSYPAKLLPHIAYFFVNAGLLSKPGDRVLDPFGGSGTVALESMLAGRVPLYCEMNPLARLIARVKTQVLDPVELDLAFLHVKTARANLVKKRLPCPDVVNLIHWYDEDVVAELSAIKAAITLLCAGPLQDFLMVCFSQACRKASRADPRLSVPVRMKKRTGREVESTWRIFEEQFASNRRRHGALLQLASSRKLHPTRLVGADARALRSAGHEFSFGSKRLANSSVQLIVTSPPYAGAQKYVRATSLSLGWLGLAGVKDLKPMENGCIGREHLPKTECLSCRTVGIEAADRLIRRVFEINPLRSAIISVYLTEMRAAIAEMFRVLKPHGHLVMILGNNTVCGVDFRTADYLGEMAERAGFHTKLRLIDEIRSRGLMTKRNKTASVITREWVLVLEKPLADKNMHNPRIPRE